MTSDIPAGVLSNFFPILKKDNRKHHNRRVMANAI